MKKFLLCFFVLFSFLATGQQVKTIKGSKTMNVNYLGTSPKLTKITPIPNRTKQSPTDIYIVPNKLTKTGMIKQIPNKRKDPVMQKAMSSAIQMSAATVKTGFDGGSNQDNANVNGIQVAPPDTQGDVGPNHYVQMTNSVTTIFDKSGNTLFGPVPNSTFFQNLDPVLAGTNDGDPVVLYDQFEDRWIVSQFAVSQGAPFFMLVAVSTTSDPLGTYNQYAIDYGTDFPDYPKLGIWNDALYITTRDFANGASFAGFSLVAINKFDMYNGVPTDAQRFEIDNPEFDGILPADADGTTPPPAGEPHYSMYLSASGNSLNLITTTIDFDNPANSTLDFGSVDVAPYSFFQTLVPQPNGQDLDVLPFFLMYRLQYVNFGTHASMLTNHSVQEVSGGAFGIRWYEFRNSGGPWGVHQQGTYLPNDGLNRWMGSVAMNENGDIALGYSVASAELNPSIRFVGQTANQSGTGILNVPETSILEGTLSSRGANRWGDYSMMSIDPVDQDFWFTTEYIAQDAAFSGWGTFISEMAFGDPPTAVCQDITVEFNADDGSVTITPEQIDNGSIGPDGGEVTLSLDIDTFDCSSLGENIVTLTATSADGITATCTAVVTVNVIDTVAPVAVCQDIAVELIDGSAEITPEQVDGGSTDNCSIESLALDQTVFNELGVFTVTLTVTDAAGQTASCEATVTVAEGAEIEVNPTSLEAEVDLQTDVPPVDEEVLTISNTGGVTLDFDIAVGVPSFTSSSQAGQDLANLDRSAFEGDTSFSGDLSAAGVKNTRIKLSKSLETERLENTTVVDSIFYDSGVDFPGDFVGFNNPAVSVGAGVRFDVPGDSFELTAVRNAYRTEAIADAAILLSIYRGGDVPTDGELLLEQVVSGDSPDGVVAFEKLNTPLTFNAGEHFWIVHTYETGIVFPQGFDDTITTTRPNTYAFSSDGGTSFTLVDGFASLVRALSEGLDNSFISLSAETGTLEPGESVDILVAFNGEGLANGTYETDLEINSNAGSNPTVTVPTTFTVSGQTSEIEVSDELLLFNDVFVGNTAERTFTISSVGGGDLNFDITSDNDDFSVEPSSGTILPGQDLEVTVAFAPSVVGSRNGILSIVSDATNAGLVEIVVNGVGVEGPYAVLDPQENFATVPATESVDVDITLSNEGGSPLVYSFPEFTMAMALQDPNAQIQRAEVIDFPNFSGEEPKGFNDTRTGAPVPFSMGTDLDFGYTWIDSDEAGGPVASFLDIIPFGATDLTSFLNDGSFADGTVSLDLPYTIPFYGEDYATIFVNANGLVSFEPPTGGTFTNGQIPVDDAANNIIAPFWADLEPGLADGGSVHILAFQDAIVVQWTNAPGFNTTGTVTFEVILFRDGTIDIQYAGVSTASFLENATVGIENTGGADGAQVAFNTDYVRDDFAVRFMPPLVAGADFISAVSPLSGVLGVGQSETITVTLDAADLDVGVFLDQLTVSSNSVNLDRSTATFELTVTEGPFAVLSPDFVQETTVTGGMVQSEITLTNGGGGTLNYSFPEFTMAMALQDPNAQIQRAEVLDFPNFSSNQPKGFNDTRAGAPVPFSMGTDFDFGYTWIDSDEDGGPVPFFFDIIPLANTLDLTPNLNDGTFADGTVALNLPYTIPFYGEDYATIFVNANGFVGFEDPTGLTFINGQIPVDDGINNIIAPFWADLEPGLADGGTVHIAAFADAIVVQWTDAPGFNTTGSVTFQVIIFTDGTIDVQYADVSNASFVNSATVGIENTGATDGAQVAFNTEYVRDNLAVRFLPPDAPFITGVSPSTGSLTAGQSETITVTLDATGFDPGVYLNDLTVSSNSRDVSQSTTTFELTVEEAPEFDNEPDVNTNLGLVDDATLSGSVMTNGRGSLEEILYDPLKEDYFITTQWNEYGVGYLENLGTPNPEEGFEWRVDWTVPKAINYITFGGTYPNQPQQNSQWEISYLYEGDWMTLDEGTGGWIDRGIFEWDGRSEEPIIASALRVRIFSDGENDLVSIHLRGRGGQSFRIDDSANETKAALIQFLPAGLSAPIADFDFTAESLTVDFDASSSSDDMTIVDYSWDFGDGNTGSGETTSHTYAQAGDYMVTLTVTDNDGMEDSTSRMLTVNDGNANFDNEPDANTNLGLVDDAVLSGSVTSGRGSLEEILYDPSKNNYFVTTQWNEYGVSYLENLGTPGPEDGFEWRVDWTLPKAINYITFGGTYPNQPQQNAVWEISYLSGSNWMILDEGVGGWVDRGIFEWDGRSGEPIVADALRVRVFSDGVNDLKSIHLRARGGLSFGIDDRSMATKATLIQFLPTEDSNASANDALISQEDTNSNGLHVYPNPTSENATMSFDVKTKITTINVFDTGGRLVRVIEANGAEDYELYLNDLMSGTYIIKVLDDKGNTFVERVLLQK